MLKQGQGAWEEGIMFSLKWVPWGLDRHVHERSYSCILCVTVRQLYYRGLAACMRQQWLPLHRNIYFKKIGIYLFTSDFTAKPVTRPGLNCPLWSSLPTTCLLIGLWLSQHSYIVDCFSTPPPWVQKHQILGHIQWASGRRAVVYASLCILWEFIFSDQEPLLLTLPGVVPFYHGCRWNT